MKLITKIKKLRKQVLESMFEICSSENVRLIHSKKDDLNLELVGSWTVEVGDLDQALHLWQYSGGYQIVDKAQSLLAKDNVNIYKTYIYKLMISCYIFYFLFIVSSKNLFFSKFFSKFCKLLFCNFKSLIF